MDFKAAVGSYVKLRDLIRKEEEEHKKAMRPKKELLDQLNGVILGMLNAASMDSARVDGVGTAYIKEDVSATIADANAFRHFVIGGEAWNLIDWRANKTAVRELVDTTGAAPPGVNFSRRRDVGVRRANGAE